MPKPNWKGARTTHATMRAHPGGMFTEDNGGMARTFNHAPKVMSSDVFTDKTTLAQQSTYAGNQRVQTLFGLAPAFHVTGRGVRQRESRD